MHLYTATLKNKFKPQNVEGIVVEPLTPDAALLPALTNLITVAEWVFSTQLGLETLCSSFDENISEEDVQEALNQVTIYVTSWMPYSLHAYHVRQEDCPSNLECGNILLKEEVCALSIMKICQVTATAFQTYLFK